MNIGPIILHVSNELFSNQSCIGLVFQKDDEKIQTTPKSLTSPISLVIWGLSGAPGSNSPSLASGKCVAGLCFCVRVVVHIL